MSIMQQAFQDVGYKPMKKQTARQMMAFNREHIIKPKLETIVDGVFEHFIKPRKVQMRQVGSHFKARYEGRKTYVFAETSTQAVKRLQYWDGDGQ